MESLQLPDCVTLARADGLATVTLDRGSYGGGMNPLSAEAVEGLRDVARWLKGDIETHCVIVSGARVFSIGADLKDPGYAHARPRRAGAKTKIVTRP